MNLEELDSVFKDLNITSPIHILNFNRDDINQNAIGGMYLVANENYKEILDKAINKKDIYDDTIIVFESRHLYELAGFTFGVLSPIKNMIADTKRSSCAHALIIRCISDIFCNVNFKKYEDIKNIVSINVLKFGFKNDMIERILYIMKNIWFLPYNDIDRFIRLGIDEYNKLHRKDDDDATENAGDS